MENLREWTDWAGALMWCYAGRQVIVAEYIVKEVGMDMMNVLYLFGSYRQLTVHKSMKDILAVCIC